MNEICSLSAVRRPGDFEPHERTWMIWPHRRDLYGPDLEGMQTEFVRIAETIARFEPVHVVVDPAHVEAATSRLSGVATVHSISVDDFWMRDSGPTFVQRPDGQLEGVSWRFNAWGQKHEPWDTDDKLAGDLLHSQDVSCRESWLTCEGGSLACDGQGTLVVTETSILNANRNPGVSRSLAESELKAMLGVEKVVWLPGDPMDRETDGHVDGMCSFVKPGVVMFEENPDPADPHSRILKANLRALMAETDARGRPFEIVPLVEAVDAEATSDIYCRSYINFAFVNGGIIMPGYGTASDAVARNTVEEAFPDRTVVQLDVSTIAAGGGAIHCITQEQPVAGSR